MSEPSGDFNIREYAELTSVSQASVKRVIEALPEDFSFTTLAAALVNAAKVGSPVHPDERRSVSDLSRLTGLDRATVTKRLTGLESIAGKRNATLYSLEDALPLLLADAGDMDDHKARKMLAEAELKEMERDEMLGKIARVDEFQEVLIRIFSSMYQRAAVRYPIEASAKLAKAKTQTAVATMLRKDFAALFARLRTDFKGFLEPESSN